MKLPPQLCREAALLLQAELGDLFLSGEEIALPAEVEEGVPVVKLVLDDPGRDQRIIVEVRLPAPVSDDEAEEKLGLALDAAQSFLGEWLEGGREERHSIDLVPHVFRDQSVLVRLERSRPSAESAADRLLQEDRNTEEPS